MNKLSVKIAALSLLLLSSSSIFAQVKIGDNPTTINTNSVLELESTNKGLLLPRVALTATNIAAPLSAHVEGMMVYNTSTTGTPPNNVIPGAYYNDGSKWLKVDTIDGTLTFLTVSNPTALSGSASSFYDYQFATESNDVLNEYNPATGIFTAARNGLYTITLCNLGSCPVGPYSGVAFINLNGTHYAGSIDHVEAAGGGNFTSILSLSLQLNAGDTLYPRVWTSPAGLSGCSLSNTPGRTFMTVMRVR